MTKKGIMLSLATIAILSGTGAVAADVNLDNAALTGKGDDKGVYKPDVASATDADKVTIKATIDKSVATDMTELVIDTKGAVEVGATTNAAEVTLGGKTAGGTDGYGFTISGKSFTTAGASGQETKINVNADSSINTSAGATIGANSSINIAEGKTLTIDAKDGLTNSGAISVGGTLNAGKITSTAGSITLGSGAILNVNDTFLNGTATEENHDFKFTEGTGKLTLSEGSKVNFNGKDNILTAKNIDLTKGGELNLNDTAILSRQNSSTGDLSDANAFKLKKGNVNVGLTTGGNASAMPGHNDGDRIQTIEYIKAEKADTGKINLNGNYLSVIKIDADAKHFNFSNNGGIVFNTRLVEADGETNTITQDKSKGSNITGKIELNGESSLMFNKGSFATIEEIDTKGGKLHFHGGTLSVKNLNANADDIRFDSDISGNTALGGTLQIANNGTANVNGSLRLTDNEKIEIAAASGSDKAGSFNLSDTLSVVGTGEVALNGGTFTANNIGVNEEGKIKLGGGTLNANSISVTDAAKNLDLAEGGTINFKGGSSTLGGKTETTAAKDTKFNVKGGSVSFDELKLTDEKGILSLEENGVVNVNKLTAEKAASLALKSGTLNFKAGTEDKKNASEIKEQLTFSNTESNVNLNFEKYSEVTFTNGLDMSNNKGAFNVEKDALVKLGTAGDKELKASEITLGGTLQANKLSAATSIDSKKLNVNFGDGAKISIEGSLGDTAKFTLGTKEDADKNYQNFLGETSEAISVKTAGNVLSLDAGGINANAELKTESGGKIRFNGGSLNVNSKLTIDNSATGLEFAEGKSGTLNFNKGDSTITAGGLNLTDSKVNVAIANGASLALTDKAALKGNGNAIALGKYAAISVDGSATGIEKLEGNGAITGDLSLAKNTILGIRTAKDADGNLQEISTGKISTADTKEGATLAFGSGSVNLKGGTESASLKLNNEGFASDLQLAENAVLDINSGNINVKGALSVATGKEATVKVSNATANFNGGFATTDYVKKFELNGGTINVKGDFTGTDLDVAHVQTNANGISSSFNISGAADIQNSKFAIVPLVDTGATSYKVLSAKSLSQSGNTGEFRVRASVKEILNKYGLQADDATKIKDEDKIVDAVDSSIKVTVEADKNNLYLKRELNTNSLGQIKADSIQADIDALNALLADTDIVNAGDKDTVLKTAQDKLNAQKVAAPSQKNSEIAAELGGENSDILLSAFGQYDNTGARDTNTKNAVALDILKNGGNGLVKDIKENAASSANMASSTSSIVNVINLSNNMAIGGRIAQANNPFGNYASLDGLKLASLSGDMPLYYANNGFENGFWANAVGGLNKIEGESGSLYGLSLGFDKQLDSTLLGFYLSYAMANLNDKTVEQGSQNIQVGLYASFNQRDIEVNVKAYGQTAITETTAYRGNDEHNTAEARFNRLYAGISADVGAIFAFNENKTFIKPFVGENYYYAHTPAYKESGVAALDVASANNHALSFDVGVDVRHYFGANSFIYLTPSVERYVVNSGGDFTAGFLGSDTTFTIEGKSSTKTYVQGLIGGNISLSDKFNINLGFGAKKILTGQIENAEGDKKDELYLSGNLGLKYRF